MQLFKKISRITKFLMKFGYKGLYLMFYSIFSKKELLNIKLSHILYPILIRNKTSDFPTFNQVFFDEEYKIDFDFEPKIIVDCGANVGYSAIYFTNKYPNSKIISIEPEKSNFDLLKKNTSGYNNIICLKGAIWNKKTNLEIKASSLGNWAFTVEESKNPSSESIEAYTIDYIISTFNIDKIDILKIDIEGSERVLFESNFESWLPSTKVIIIELHEKMHPDSEKPFFKALSNYKYTSYYRGENLIVVLNQKTL